MVGFAGQLFVGLTSDRLNKPVLVISLSLFVVASGLCAISPDLATLSVARRYRRWATAPQCRLAAPSSGTVVRPNRAGLSLCKHDLGDRLHHRPDRRSDRGKRWVAGNIHFRRRCWRADSDLHFRPVAGNEPPVDAERDQSEKTDRELCDTALQPRIHGLRDVQHNLLRGHLRVHVLQRLCPSRASLSFAGDVRRLVWGHGRGVWGRHASGRPVYPALGLKDSLRRTRHTISGKHGDPAAAGILQHLDGDPPVCWLRFRYWFRLSQRPCWQYHAIPQDGMPQPRC